MRKPANRWIDLEHDEIIFVRNESEVGYADLTAAAIIRVLTQKICCDINLTLLD